MALDSKLNVKEIEELINDSIVLSGAENTFVFNELIVLYNLCIITFDALNDVDKSIFNDFNINKFAKTSFLDNQALIKNFYQENHIKFDLDKLMRNGTIDYIYNEDNTFYSFNGTDGYNNGIKYVNVYNNGLITDAVTLVHEVSHYRNQTDYARNQINNVLTESVAYAEELIFIDYLKNNGYKDEMNFCTANLLINAKLCAIDSMILFKMVNLYKIFGNLSLANYQLYYHDSTDYLNDLNKLKSLITTKNYNIYRNAGYAIGYPLGFYMYMEYKKNNQFLNKIESLHTKISNDNILNILRSINLTNLGANDLNKIKDAVMELKETTIKKIKHL
jgi:hypothetical protein